MSISELMGKKKIKHHNKFKSSTFTVGMKTTSNFNMKWTFGCWYLQGFGKSFLNVNKDKQTAIIHGFERIYKSLNIFFIQCIV